MSHLNDLQSKLGEKGLSVIGVTGESAAQTDPWVAKHGAKYAYAYDKGNSLGRQLGITGLPGAVLVDPSGTVVWKGHPSGLTDAVVEKHLGGALPKPLWEWPKVAAPVAKAISAGKFKNALAAAQKIANDPEGGEYAGLVEAAIEARATAVEKAFESGDYLRAQQMATLAKKALSGLPQAKRVSEVLSATKRGEAKSVIKLQKKVLKARDEIRKLRSRKKVDEAIDGLRRVAKKGAGTAAERDAEDLIAELEKMAQRMR